MNPREYDALFETEDRHWWFVALRREVARAIERHVPAQVRGRLRWLDEGSGTGGLLAHLQLPREVVRVGADQSLQALGLARRRRPALLAAGSAMALPFPDDSFDLITSIDLLAHRNVEKRPALAEALRCLKPEGIFVFQSPAFDWLASEHDRAVWNDRRFRRGEVERLFAEAGFAVRECFYRIGILFPVAALTRIAGKGSVSEEDARSQVRPTSGLTSAFLGGLLRLESAAAAVGLRLPFGLSVFCIARKP